MAATTAKAPAPAPLPKKLEPTYFTAVRKAVVGLAVFACNTPADGVANPRPAVVTRAFEDVPGLVDVETFHPRSSSYMHAHPVESAAMCFTVEEMDIAIANGKKWICYPYDPADPKPYKQAPNAPAPKRAGTPE